MYIKYIKEIKSQCKSLGYGNLYASDEYVIRLWKNEKGYLDNLEFKKIGSFLWSVSTPEIFFKQYLKPKLEYIHYIRYYGEPKLEKPKEIKGMPINFSIDYIPNKCKCSVVACKNDVWIKHKDYFSSFLEVEKEDEGKSLAYLSKKYLGKEYKRNNFIYDDCYGPIVLRNEAWICIKNLMLFIKRGEIIGLENKILKLQEKVCGLEEFELQGGNMHHMWERLIKELSLKTNKDLIV